MNTTAAPLAPAALPTEAATQVLATIRRPTGRRSLGIVAAVVVLGAAGAAFAFMPKEAPRPWVTDVVARGDVAAVVSANGSLRGTDTVEIGAETSGRVQSVLVKVNDHVAKGQLLAVVDDATQTANLRQAQAQLKAARADVSSRQATVVEQQRATERTVALFDEGLVSARERDSAVAALARAEAAVSSSEAQVTVASASVLSAQVALDRTQIRSPMDGVVLSRSVEPGQSLQSAFSTPVLFVVARDLSEMELVIQVDEADVGRVAIGQEASFVVDAWANQRFRARLTAISELGVSASGVVSYEGTLVVDNSERHLKPGMTATVELITASEADVVVVDNAALRFVPERNPAAAAGAPAPTGPAVWRLEGDALVRVPVVLGVTDGEHTAVLSGVDVGDVVVTATAAPGSRS